MQDPSIQTDQTALERQMRLAEMLRGQSLQGFGPTESFGGYAVKRSPLEGAAKIVQALMAGKMDKSNDAARGALATKQGAAMQALMANMLGGPQSTPPNVPQNGPLSPAGPGMTMGGVSAPPAPQQAAPQAPQESPQVAQLKRAAMSAMLTGNTDLANKLIGNLLEMTGEQKDMQAMGMDPRLMGQLRTAAARKGGMMEMQPGTTTMDLATGAERFQPKLGEGVRLGQSGAAEAVPGYAQAAGAIRGAEAEGTEGAKLIDVDIGGGRTVKMPQSQYLAMKNGPPPAVAAAAAKNGDRGYMFNVGGQAGAVSPGTLGVRDPVGMAAATAEATGEAGKVGQFHGDNYSKIQQAGQDATGTIARMDQLKGLLDGVNTGKLTPAGTELAAFAEALGLKVDPKLGNKQAADALSKEISLQLRNPAGGAGMPGAMSDADRQYLVKMTPSLANTPEGNALMIDARKKLAQRDQEVASLALDYRLRTGKMDEGFQKELLAYAKANPLFAQPKPVAAPPRRPAATGATGKVPAGVDAALWGVMTPAERALWK